MPSTPFRRSTVRRSTARRSAARHLASLRPQWALPADLRGQSALLAAAALVTLLCVPLPATAQEYGLSVGVGRTFWSGSAADDRWSAATRITGASLFREWPLTESLAGRLEVGGRLRGADLGETGLFAQPTTVELSRAQLGALVRPSMPVGSGGWHLYGEVGVGGWARTLCDVDLEGGPGLFGGETVACDEWLSDEGIGPLVSRATGVSFLAGAGARRGPWAVGVRYEVDTGDALGSPQGTLRTQSLEVTGGWVFAGASSPAVATTPVSRDAHPMVAGLLEAVVPMAGFAYAQDVGAGILPNVVRVSGPVVAVVGWGTDNGSMVIGGIMMWSVGTVWAIIGAARSADDGA